MPAAKTRIATAAILAALSLCGCRDEASRAKDRTILCSFHPMYVATLNIARGVPGVRVENMTTPQTGCLHDYQLTPADMRRIEDAWVFVANGGGMESFLSDIVQRRPDLHVVDASRGIAFIHGDGNEGDNAHVWVSVSGAIAQAHNIAEQLSAIDQEHAGLYRKNGERYAARLDSLRVRMHQALDGLPVREIVTFHEAFPYFASEFGLRIAAVVEREPGSEPSAAELARTVEIVRKSGTKAVFAEPQYPAKAAQAVAREAGVQVRILDPAVSGPEDPDSYIRTMDANLAVLREALSGK
jgi:zinc transport system substrate-binding protein